MFTSIRMLISLRCLLLPTLFRCDIVHLYYIYACVADVCLAIYVPKHCYMKVCNIADVYQPCMVVIVSN